MSLIEEFTESEKQRLNWRQKLSANYPDVTETRLLARGYAEPEPLKIDQRAKLSTPASIVAVAFGIYNVSKILTGTKNSEIISQIINVTDWHGSW